MEAIFPRGSTAHIDTIGSDLRIKIKSPTNWFRVIFMLVWLFFWANGELVVLSVLFGGLIPASFDFDVPTFDFGGDLGPFGIIHIFLLVWLLIWTYFGIQVANTLLKTLAGSEVVEVNSGGITIGRQIFDIGLPKVYASDKISSLRLANKEDQPSMRTRSLGRGKGTLAFDHGYDTVTFGVGLKRDAAEEIIRKIGSRFSHYLAGAA